MTKNEMMIIAIAAAVFIIANIIMWRIILRKERKRREATTPPPDLGIRLPDGVPDAAGALGFKLIESTVIVHTEERLNDG